ncbi:MAG: relaxase/mobilization nuclease domain-containing protein [Symploca sp. SIO1C4]|uniref:Relaxase/mobilization nuclease domain-containing protein n=1 Tax=Symploca sp. SIO1C4 TaxID=2607765 RepID=A0A6B3N7Q1_9CYAN|nr:relaxase/mobilization nuclease domain-containing protein [Symploca sp. SIO1C4]
MIGKQIKGRGFRGLLNYLTSKEGAELIGGNMVGTTPRELAAEFRFSRRLNPNLSRAVYHASLSLPKQEWLSQDQWNSLVEDYLKGMGFDYNQYCLFQHHDREHEHVHIVASRIRLDGTTVSESWDYVRSEKLLRQLEKQYGLEAPQVSESGKRAPTTGQKRRQMREQLEYFRGERNTAPEPTVGEKLQDAIDQATTDELTMPQLINRLKDTGIDAKVSYYSTGRVQGITYGLEGLRFSGTKLGKAYTFPGLQRHRGVSYESSQDEEIREASERTPVTLVVSPIDKADEEQHYQQLWQRYNRGIEVTNRVTRDYRVSRNAFDDGLSQKEIELMLMAESPHVQWLERERGNEKARVYATQVARVACQKERKEQQLSRQRQRESQLEL